MIGRIIATGMVYEDSILLKAMFDLIVMISTSRHSF